MLPSDLKDCAYPTKIHKCHICVLSAKRLEICQAFLYEKLVTTQYAMKLGGFVLSEFHTHKN